MIFKRIKPVSIEELLESDASLEDALKECRDELRSYSVICAGGMIALLGLLIFQVARDRSDLLGPFCLLFALFPSFLTLQSRSSRQELLETIKALKSRLPEKRNE